MVRMPAWRLCCLSLFFGSLATGPGCSDGSHGTIDTKSVIAKASGGEGTARQTEKTKAASEEAAKKHPKLH